MSLDDELPTHNARRPRTGLRRLSASTPIDVSASLEEFIGNACALADEPPPIEEAAEPEPEPLAIAEPAPAAEPDLIARRMEQIEAALARATSRAAALGEVPAPEARARGRFGVNAVSMAIGAFLAVGVLLVGYGRSQGERQVSAAPAAAASPAPQPAPVAAAQTAAVAAPEPAPAAAPQPAPAEPVVRQPAPIARAAVPPRRRPGEGRPVRRPQPKTGGIVDPFAD